MIQENVAVFPAAIWWDSLERHEIIALYEFGNYFKAIITNILREKCLKIRLSSKLRSQPCHR